MPIPLFNNLTLEQVATSHPRKVLQRECADRDPRSIFRSPIYVSAPPVAGSGSSDH